MTNFTGAVIGAALDRQDGDSGIKGAIAGMLGQSTLRVVLPIVATYAIGWVVLSVIRHVSDTAASEMR